MSRLHSSQELVIYQVDVDRLSSQSSSRPYTAPHTLGGSSNVGAAAILTPEIRKRPEWFSSLDSVKSYSLPRYLYASTFSSSRHKQVRYVSDGYDRKWLSKRAAYLNRNKSAGTGSSSTISVSTEGIITEDDVCIFEDVMTLLEMEAIHHPETSFNQLHAKMASKGVDPVLMVDIYRYWRKKRYALGGNVSCIPSLWRNEDQQTLLCRSEILGDCPIPFKCRDWLCAVIFRKPSTVSARKRTHTQCDFESSARRMCVAALNLSTQIFLREQLQWEHTCSAIYELSYMRSFASKSGNNNTVLDENLAGDQEDPVVINPEEVTNQLLALPCVS